MFWEKGNSQCKSPEVGTSLVGSRATRAASVSAAGQVELWIPAQVCQKLGRNQP